MRIRQAKKILYARHWVRYCQQLRPVYFDEGRGVWVCPSFSDIPNPTYQKARRKYLGAARRFYDRHGYCFDDRSKGGKANGI